MSTAAARGFGWIAIVRLGLVQAAIGAIVMLATSLLNRVMVVEYALAAAIPAGLVAWHYAVQLARPLWGHGSDRGRKRTPWIGGGMAVLAGGALLAVRATTLMPGSALVGGVLAVAAFAMIGFGVGAAGTSMLALLASGVRPERRAAAAIAEAEAQQLAEEQRLARLAEATRLADATAEKRRLAEEEAARVARMEAIRQAKLDAEQAAAARAEATRLAELEARRIAHAETEALRLANIEADRLAEARRVAAAEVQALRAPVQYVSMANAVSLPVAPTPQVKPLVRTPKAKPVATWAAYSGPMPTTASLKLSKPLVLVAQTPVERAAPPALKPNGAHVRAFDRPQPVRQASQKVEAFMAERVQRTADAPVSAAALETLQAEFLSIVNSAQDGAVSTIALPQGGQIEITVEQTTMREASRPVLKTVSYSVSEYNAVQRSVTAQVDRSVALTCRDISYVIPGKERGRFAACESGKGEWLISRASEEPKSSI